MKRIFLTACALALLVVPAPAPANHSIEGFVTLPAAHPAVPRMLYLRDVKVNGWVGYVVELGREVVEPLPFRLATIPNTGATGLEDLDVWFYRDITGTGDPCPRAIDSTPEGGETGTICPGATHAVVVLFAGADVEFELLLG